MRPTDLVTSMVRTAKYSLSISLALLLLAPACFKDTPEGTSTPSGTRVEKVVAVPGEHAREAHPRDAEAEVSSARLAVQAEAAAEPGPVQRSAPTRPEPEPEPEAQFLSRADERAAPAEAAPAPAPRRSKKRKKKRKKKSARLSASFKSEAPRSSAAKKKISLALGNSPLGSGYGAPSPSAPQDTTEGTGPGAHGDKYAKIDPNQFTAVSDEPLSTFSIDVDTASYANVRRMLREGIRPPADSVRLEEFVNYFDYDYPNPTGTSPFAVVAEVARSPWASERRLVHIGIQGKHIAQSQVPPRNLVFLLDVSGSMNAQDKLPLLVHGLTELSARLRPEDKVSIVVYAGASGVVLDTTTGDHRRDVIAALRRLGAGGSTNGGAGIELAYKLARREFIKGGINRVILATDGDFNVGTTSLGELQRLIERQRKSGVFLTVLGFGRGNLGDSTMEMLADKGNGNYAYIDSPDEAHKVLVREAGATLVTIAKDVKIQVEFNPAKVARYRLLGYENRLLAAKDFADDKKDAGEIGAGHTVTALYEIELVGEAKGKGKVAPLVYQDRPKASKRSSGDELLLVKVRHKHPNGSKSVLMQVPVKERSTDWHKTSPDFRFSAAVAGFALRLRGDAMTGAKDLAKVRLLAKGALGKDPHGDRHEFVRMLDDAERLGY